MLEYDLMRQYADTINSANEILFLDNSIQNELRHKKIKEKIVKNNLKEMLDSIQDWEKKIRLYKKTLVSLKKRELNEKNRELQKDTSNALNEKNSEKIHNIKKTR